MKRTIPTLALAAVALLVTAGTASAADCGAPAKAATYKIVKTPGSDAVTKVVDTLVTPATPAVFEDVKVIDVVAVPATYKDVKVIDHAAIPPVEEVSHIEHVLVTPGTPEVAEVSHQECRVQHWFAKYTETHSGKKDSRGVIVYGPFSAWEKWTPETHTSWQDGTAPLGNPAFHASWTEGKGANTVYFERLWQARDTGITRQVDCHKVIDVAYQPAVPPTYRDDKVIDVEAQPGVAEVSHLESVIDTPAVEEVSHLEHRLVTPAVPAVYRADTLVVKEAVKGTSKKVLLTRAVAAGEPCKPKSDVPQLAFTGSNDVLPLTGAGLGLILLGGLLIAARRQGTQR